MIRLAAYSFALLSTLAWQPAHARDMIDHPTVKLRALDKITARTVTFEADVGTVIKFGSLYIKTQACRKAPPIEVPESAAFLQVWEEHQAKEKSSIGIFDTVQEWVFSGWMFASSPALSHLDHPIYDVWVLDCLNKVEEAISVESGDLNDGEGAVEEKDAPAPQSQMPDLSTQEQDTTAGTLPAAVDAPAPLDASPIIAE